MPEKKLIQLAKNASKNTCPKILCEQWKHVPESLNKISGIIHHIIHVSQVSNLPPFFHIVLQNCFTASLINYGSLINKIHN